MIRYRVIDLSQDGVFASLLDADGCLHIARIPGFGLQRGDVMHGRRAKLGCHVLIAERHHAPLVHARFESLACSQDAALRLMHPLAGA